MIIDWLAFLLRWLHIVAAIAWVGASFYFIWVENQLIRSGKQRSDKVAGHLWAIHGGGFYYLEKQSVAPMPLPPQLHWFKWEAYTTWLSGVALMTVLYYFNPSVWLVSSESTISGGTGVLIGIAYFFISTIVYSVLSRTPLLNHPLWFGAVGLLWVALSTWVLLQVFLPRAVFLHIGAALGTIMVGNVIMVIIPTQKRIVATVEKGEVPDMKPSVYAGLCSAHNNYLALPVVFLMISLHTPFLSTGAFAPLTVVAIIAMAGCIRHVINIKNKGNPLAHKYIVLAVVSLMVAVLSALSPLIDIGNAEKVTQQQIRQLADKHCVGCHSAQATDALFTVAPLGYIVDTDEQIMLTRDKFYKRIVLDRTMPFNNKTKMTEQERHLVARWYQQDTK